MSPLSQAVLCERRSGVGPMPHLLRGRHFMGCHSPLATHPEEVSFRSAFLLPTFLWQDAPKEVPLGDKEK
jgi:hypothetical protein